MNNIDSVENFICFLIDKKETEIIYEVNLHVWYAEFLKSDYNKEKLTDEPIKVNGE